MEDLISVIVPVYNVEKYLNKCIHSIAQQTYRNLEIILIDDGSCDRCGGICDEWAKIDGRVKVIHKENGGLSDARNVGIKASSGSFIMFVDSDDYLEHDCIDIMYKRILLDKTDVALSRLVYIDEFGVILTDKLRNLDDEVVSSSEALKRVVLGNPLYIVACAKLYKKEIFDDLKFPVGKIHEDEFVAHKIFGNCDSVSCVSGNYYYYLQRRGSITNRGVSAQTINGVEALLDRAQYCFDIGLEILATISMYSFVNAYVERVDEIEKNNGCITDEKDVLINGYKNLYSQKKRILFKNSSLKLFLVLSLFNISHNIYGFLFKTYLKLKHVKGE